MSALGLVGAGNVSAASTISVSSSGAQSIDVLPGSSGSGTSIGVDEITVSTTCRAGYNFSLSASVNDNNLYLNGSNSNNESGKYFTPADGTTTLDSSTNTWGYYYNSSAPTTAPTSANTFLAVPTLSSTAAIIKTPATTASSTDIADTFNIYYGVSASSNLTPGTYKMIPDTNNSNVDGSIVYYVTMAQNCLPYTVVFNPTSTAGGTTLTGSGTMSDQTIQPGVATALTTNTFTAPTGYEFDSWNTAQDGTGTSYTDGQSVTDLTTGGTSITLYAQWKQPPINLYDAIATMSKGTQTLNDLQAVITTPTSSDPSTDTSNSGVYEYDASLFGTSSDASNDYKIYYYRGILDSNLDGTTSTYGSNGDGAYYPNYVKLGNTCWRIVRTTGSGGVKMIYNGLYSSGTTANSCANATTNAQVTTQAFGLKGNSSQSTYWYRNINRVGYTFNNTSSLQDSTTSTSVDTVFGSNSNYSTINTANSNIKDYIENTWFTGSNGISAYESILEPSAGYCNDRTAFSNTAGTTTLSTIPPYATSSATMYFGAYARNRYAGGKLSLTCPASRNTVDLYTTASASGGNKQLAKPVALLTADEAALAGSGYNSNTGGTAASTFSSNYSYSSYLRSGSDFWLLSPGYRYSGGYAAGFTLYSGGYLYSYSVGGPSSVRPAISLKEGTEVSSGSGTAADPWVVEAPTTMQDFAAGTASTSCSAMSTGDTLTLVDSRDNQLYTVGKLADGKCWMLDNLALDLTNSTVLNAMNESNTNASNTTLGYLKGTSTGTTSDKYATAAVSNWTSGYSYSAPLVNMTNKDIVPQGDDPMAAQALAGNWKVGGYYNYCAASAGSYCYGDGTSYGTSSGNATEDICPAGWRMPTGNTYGEFSALANAIYGSTGSTSDATAYANYRSALRLPLSGYFGYGSPDNQGSYGYWWSSTRRNNNYMYSLYANTSTIYPAGNSARYNGFSLRCMAGS